MRSRGRAANYSRARSAEERPDATTALLPDPLTAPPEVPALPRTPATASTRSRGALPVGRWLAAAFALAFCVGAGIGLLQRGDAHQVTPSGAALAGEGADVATSPVLPVAFVPASEGEPSLDALSARAAEELPPHRVASGELEPGETLATSLSIRGISGPQIHTIVTEMAPVFNFRYAQPGDRYRLVLDADGEIDEFRYERSPIEHYELRRAGDGFEVRRETPELIRRRARLAGVVTSNLYDAVTHLGEDSEIAHDFADIFAWDIDFSREVQPGDEFSVLYERLYTVGEDGEEVYVRPGQILAARYSTLDGEYMAVYFEPVEGRGGYYRPDGSAVERQFLRAPLHYRRISSGYTHSRLHPILKVRRPHLGVDYSAPRGTPVWSVANGQVIARGYQRGLGNAVKVRHGNGYVTVYGHLSRFAQSLRVGQRVHQKQVIGYVGSSGLSTGPHLHFQLERNGKTVNPALLRSPAGEPIPSEARSRFHASREDLMAALDPSPLVVTNEAL